MSYIETLRGFTVPDTDMDTWCETHDLDPKPIECPFCGSELTAVKPFATETMRGVVYTPCTCADYPKDQAPFLYGAADKEEREIARAQAEKLYMSVDDEYTAH